MSRLRIVHTTGFTYDKPVRESYNEARMTPMTHPHQVVLESYLEVSPGGAGGSSYQDYWGTKVDAFDVHTPHSHLNVNATATVEVHRTQRGTDPAAELEWTDLGDRRVVDGFSDWLPQTPLTAPTEAMVEDFARFRSAPRPEEAVRQVLEWIHADLRYVRGSTQVHSPASQAWETREGVCQDLVHLAVGALRSMGVPARYVSGYLHPQPDVDPGTTVEGESHAWLEWWNGGWKGWDPANDAPIGDYHVSVARGREYTDVPPLKGIYSGASESELFVKVSVTKLA